MLEIDPKDEFVISDNIILKTIPNSDQYYAFNVENGDHFSLNSTAYWVLKKFEHINNVGSLLEVFIKTFKLKKEEALKDLSELLNSAFENKIIFMRRHNDEEKENV